MALLQWGEYRPDTADYMGTASRSILNGIPQGAGEVVQFKPSDTKPLARDKIIGYLGDRFAQFEENFRAAQENEQKAIEARDAAVAEKVAVAAELVAARAELTKIMASEVRV